MTDWLPRRLNTLPLSHSLAPRSRTVISPPTQGRWGCGIGRAARKADNTWKAAVARAYAGAVERWSTAQDHPTATRQSADAAARATFEEANATAANTYLDKSGEASKTWYTAVSPEAKKYLEALADNALAYLNTVAPQLVTYFDALVGHAVTAFNTVVNELKQFAESTLGNAVSWLTSVTTNLNETAGEVVDNAKTAFDKIAGEADEYLDKVTDELVEAVNESTGIDTQLIQDVAEEMVDAAADFTDDVFDGDQAFFSVPDDDDNSQTDTDQGDAGDDDDGEEEYYVSPLPPDPSRESPAWEAVKTGFHVFFVDEIYEGGKAVLNGTASRRLGDRAVKIVENSNQRPFAGSAYECWQFTTRGLMGDLSGMNFAAEAGFKVDLETEQILDPWARSQKTCLAIGSVAGVGAAVPKAVTGTAALAIGPQSAAKAFPWMTAAGGTALPGSAIVTTYVSGPATRTMQLVTAPAGRAMQKTVSLLPESVQNAGGTAARFMTKERRYFWQSEVSSNAPVTVRFVSQNAEAFAEFLDNPQNLSGGTRAGIEALADSYRGLSKSTRPAAVSRLELKFGAFDGAAGIGEVEHSVVQELMRLNPGKFNGACAELRSIADALRAYESLTGVEVTTIEQAKGILEGSVMRTARVRSRGSVSGQHGAPLEPCEGSCRPILDLLGIIFR